MRHAMIASVFPCYSYWGFINNNGSDCVPVSNWHHPHAEISDTLDTFILASKKFHSYEFTRLISYFNISYLG